MLILISVSLSLVKKSFGVSLFPLFRLNLSNISLDKISERTSLTISSRYDILLVESVRDCRALPEALVFETADSFSVFLFNEKTQQLQGL